MWSSSFRWEIVAIEKSKIQLRINSFSAVIIPYIIEIVKNLLSIRKFCGAVVKEKNLRKVGFIFKKSAGLSLSSVVCCCADRKGGKAYENMINELWHGNIIPQEDSRNNSKEMKELLGYMARHHEDLAKTFTDEQKKIFEKFHDCWSEYMSLSEAAIFEYAFKLGMQMAIETLK